MFRHGFCEAEGSAPLHYKESRTAEDRASEKQQSRSFAFALRAWYRDESIACSAQDGAFIEKSEWRGIL
jgi:hypothetical protein